MSFLTPIFLFALTAVALPLVIHLLNLRKPKRIQFSTLAFFKELQKTTIRKIRIKRLLLLALRLLAIACLAMVLARPFLPPIFGTSASSNLPTIYAILIDNSISMSRIGSKGPLINQAKEIVQAIAVASKEDDRFIIQTTNGEQINASTLTAAQLERRIGALNVTNSGAFLAERMNTLLLALEESPYQNKKLYIIEDGNQDLETVLTGDLEQQISNYAVSVLSVEDVSVQNTFVTGISTSSSIIGEGIPLLVDVSVQNAGDVIAANQFLTVLLEGETIGQYSLQIDPQETQTFSFEINPSQSGAITGLATIEGDGFLLDNNYFFSVQIPDQRNVLWVQKQGANPNEISYTSAILDAHGAENTQIKYSKITQGEFISTSIDEFDALILDGLNKVPEFMFSDLQEFVQQGKGIVFFPSQIADIENYNRFLNLFNAGNFTGVSGDYASFNSIAKGSVLLEDHPVFSGLFELNENEQLSFAMPDVYYYLKLQTNNSGFGLNVIEMNNGDPLLREKKFGEGRLIVSTIGNDPAWSSFPVKALFAPTYYRTILYAASLEEGGLSNHLLGETFRWRGEADPKTTELVWNEETIQVNPQNLGGTISLDYKGYEWEPGWVTITDGEKIYKTALNLPGSESVFERSENTIAENINLVDTGSLSSEEIAGKIQTSGFGKEVWHWFMLAGFLLLVTESLVSIFYKAETIN